MSRRRQHLRSKAFPWPILTFCGVLLITAALLLAGPYASGTDGSGAPSISVDRQKIDFGEVKLDTVLSFAITVTNTGDGILRFQETPYIEIVEGCWPPELTIGSMVLKPGESTQIQSSSFMMHAGMEGPHNFGVHLITNDPQARDKVVNVLSNWVP